MKPAVVLKTWHTQGFVRWVVFNINHLDISMNSHTLQILNNIDFIGLLLLTTFSYVDNEWMKKNVFHPRIVSEIKCIRAMKWMKEIVNCFSSSFLYSYSNMNTSICLLSYLSTTPKLFLFTIIYSLDNCTIIIKKCQSLKTLPNDHNFFKSWI